MVMTNDKLFNETDGEQAFRIRSNADTAINAPVRSNFLVE
jgi:hypothetical protein